MTAQASRLLLLPFAALGDEAALGVWARQLPQLLARLLPASAGATAPLWRAPSTGRLVRAAAPWPASVVKGEADAAGCAQVLTGAVRRTDEGLEVSVALVTADGDRTDRWSELLVTGREANGFASLLKVLTERLGIAPKDPPGAPSPLWPYLCDLEVEAELEAHGVAGLSDTAFAWSHLRTAAEAGSDWSGARLASRRTLLARIAPELLTSFDAESRRPENRDYSTDDVLQLLGIEAPANPSSPQG